MALIRCENVSIGYEGQTVVKDLSFQIDAGDYLHCLEAVTAFVSHLDREKLERYRNNNA